MLKKMFLGIFSALFFLVSCSNDDNGSSTTTRELTLNLNGLEDLGSDFVYEGWIIVDGSPVSTGTFAVDETGVLSETSFDVDAAMLASATAFVLSIEPAVDPDPAPADTKILSGDFVSDTAEVNSGIVGDFSDASGTFFLRTPTDEVAGNNGNDQYGVWFGTPGAPPTPNFTLPELPDGWIYEGWVVVDGVGPLTTGTFSEFNTEDNMAPFSGENPGPPVPGEDFFENAPDGFVFPLDVRNRTVVISVEPVPDNSPAPFLLKPLRGLAGMETAPATHNLDANLGSLPTGSVSR